MMTNAILIRESRSADSLGQAQADSLAAVGLIHRMLRTGVGLTAEQLHLGAPDLKVLHDRRESLQLSEQRLIQLQLARKRGKV